MEGQRNETLPLGGQGRGETGNLALSAGRSLQPCTTYCSDTDKKGQGSGKNHHD